MSDQTALSAANLAAVAVSWSMHHYDTIDEDFVLESLYAAIFAHESRILAGQQPADAALLVVSTLDAAKRHQIGPTAVFLAMNQHPDGISGWYQDRGEDARLEIMRIRDSDDFPIVLDVTGHVIRGVTDMLRMLREIQALELD